MSSRSADDIIRMVLFWEMEVLFFLWTLLLFALTIDLHVYRGVSCFCLSGDLSYKRKCKEAMMCVIKHASFSKFHYNHFAFEQHVLQGDTPTKKRKSTPNEFWTCLCSHKCSFCWSRKQETTFYIFVCSDIDCAFNTDTPIKHSRLFSILWVIMTLSFLGKKNKQKTTEKIITCKNDINS